MKFLFLCKWIVKKTNIVVICLTYLQVASYFDTSKTWTRKPLCFTLSEIQSRDPVWRHVTAFLANFLLKLQKTCCNQRRCCKVQNTVRRKLSAFQQRDNQVSMIRSSWDLLNEIILTGSHSTAFGASFFVI